MTGSGSGPGHGNREERVAALLAAAAAPRQRVVDEHMFTVAREHHPAPATFRLQLFTAPERDAAVRRAAASARICS